MAAGAADGRVLLLDVVRDCVLAQLGQHAGGVHSLAWVCHPCHAGAGGHSECQPSNAPEGGAGAAPAGLASAGGQACLELTEAGLACAPANGWHSGAAVQANADSAGSLDAAKAGVHDADAAGGQQLLTNAAMPQSESAPQRTLLASSGADRTVHVHEVCAVAGNAAEGPQEGGGVSAEHICSLALPKPPVGLSEAQRGRLWVATAWAPPQWGYQELAGAPEDAKGLGSVCCGAGAKGRARGCMEAGEDAGGGEDSADDESLGSSVEPGGGLHLGAAASHWLITSSYGGALPGCLCSQGGWHYHVAECPGALTYSSAGALYAWNVPLQPGMPAPLPVRIPGRHTRAIFSIHCSAESAADPISVLHPDMLACEDGQGQVAESMRDSSGVAGARAEGSGCVAGQASAQGQCARSFRIITTSLDRSVQLWHVSNGADGMPCDAWKAAKVGFLSDRLSCSATACSKCLASVRGPPDVGCAPP